MKNIEIKWVSKQVWIKCLTLINLSGYFNKKNLKNHLIKPSIKICWNSIRGKSLRKSILENNSFIDSLYNNQFNYRKSWILRLSSLKFML